MLELTAPAPSFRLNSPRGRALLFIGTLLALTLSAVFALSVLPDDLGLTAYRNAAQLANASYRVFIANFGGVLLFLGTAWSLSVVLRPLVPANKQSTKDRPALTLDLRPMDAVFYVLGVVLFFVYMGQVVNRLPLENGLQEALLSYAGVITLAFPAIALFYADEDAKKGRNSEGWVCAALVITVFPPVTTLMCLLHTHYQGDRDAAIIPLILIAVVHLGAGVLAMWAAAAFVKETHALPGIADDAPKSVAEPVRSLEEGSLV